MKKSKLFIAIPMSSIPASEYYKVNKHISKMTDVLTASGYFESIYYAGNTLEKDKVFDSPIESARKDIEAIYDCDVFILIYPKATPTSAIFEAGIAYALRKKSYYFTFNDTQLPFLLRELPDVIFKVIKDFSEIVSVLIDNNCYGGTRLGTNNEGTP